MDRELVGTPIRVQEEGIPVKEAQSRRGGVRFCDLGIRTVKIVVGDTSCNEVTVSNVPLQWGEMVTTKVTYDRRACSRETRSPIPQCEILFRFMDEQRKWIPGVTLAPPLIAGVPDIRSDSFGRYLIGVEFGREVSTAAQRDGYYPQEIRMLCDRSHMLHEQIVVLSARPK
jgi:hypothetical protein